MDENSVKPRYNTECFKTSTQLNMHAVDCQLYASADTDPVCSRKVNLANAWYEINGMIANPNKHQGMILGNTEYEFKFRVNDTMDLFGVTIDKDLPFKKYSMYSLSAKK